MSDHPITEANRHAGALPDGFELADRDTLDRSRLEKVSRGWERLRADLIRLGYEVTEYRDESRGVWVAKWRKPSP
jgi:hypothetical protein